MELTSILPIRPGLLQQFDYVPTERKVRKIKAKFGMVRTTQKVKYPDWVVLEVRLMSERGSIDSNIVLTMASYGVSMTKVEIYRIKEYATRSYLVPDKNKETYYNEDICSV